MVAPAWLTPSQLAAYERGAARALALDDADTPAPTTTAVHIDRGGGERTHIAWCLAHQRPASQCCHADAVEQLVEDPVDAEADIATLIATSRSQLALHAAAAAGIEDTPITGGRL